MFNSRYNLLDKNNPVNEILSSYTSNQIRPFKLNWLNSAHLETLLPGSNWEKIYDAIVPEFCEKISSHFLHENKKQALFELLGKTFTSKYFPDDTVDVSITKPPVLSTEESIKLYEESESLLNLILDQIIKAKAIHDKEKNIMSKEMKNYNDQVNQIFTDHFKKELAKKEAEYLKNISITKRNFRPSNGLLHHKPETAVSSVFDKDLPNAIEYIYPYGPEMLIAPEPHCISFQSEFIGLSLANLCQQNLNETIKVCTQMSGRRLPISLRKFLWKSILYESDSQIYNRDINFEELIKEKFSRAVTRGVAELKISKDMMTPVNELLENLIVEHYERCVPLKKFDFDFKSEALKILNLLYVYDRSYDRHLIFWLFPLHYGLKEEIDDLPMNKTPFAYDMALYLNLLRNIYPSWPVIFEIAEKVMIRLSNWNQQFVNHLFDIAQINVESQFKDFLVQIIELEKNKTKTTKPVDNSTQVNSMQNKIANLTGSDLIKSPIIFIRKWIGEGFVSILKNEAVLYIFDQLFMEKFSSKVFQDACIAIILLLQNDFLKTEDHNTMKNVFLRSPFNLLTLDFIRAWTWIHKGGNFSMVLEMNRKEMYPCPPKSNLVEVPRAATVHSILLPNVAFNDIRLKLIFNEDSFVKNLKEESLFLTLTMCFNSTDISQLLTNTSPKLKLQITNERNQIICNYRFDPLDIINFHDLDVTHFTDLYKQGDIFYVLLVVQYQESEDNVTTLGWCILQCFIEDDSSGPQKLMIKDLLKPSRAPPNNRLKDYVSRLKIQSCQLEIPIICGKVPKDTLNFQSNQNGIYDILSEGSMLTIYTYNPDQDQPAQVVKTPSPEPVIEENVEIPPPEPEIVKPVPTPIPITEPIYQPKSQIDKEPPPRDDSYVPYNPDAYEKIKPPYTTKVEPFCLYLDQIRFLPDNATIVKVTGRFVQTGVDAEIPDILVFTDVESDPRSPTFRPSARIVINEARKLLLLNSTILILRVYTVLKTNLQIVVVGNCIIPIFNSEGLLLSGCYQKRLRNQLPDVGLVNSNNVNSKTLDNAPYIDAVSITLRLWPLTKNPIIAPEYKTGSYQSMECLPTDFEWEIFYLYKKDTMLPKDLRAVVKDIKYRDNNPAYNDLAVTHEFMQPFIPYRLDITKHLPENEAPKNINSKLMFHYRIEKGIHFKIDQVFGLKSEMLLFATAKVLRGYTTANMEPRIGKKYGLDEFIIFSNLDPNRSMRSSKWLHPFEMIRPYYDEQALLIVQIWGIDAVLINDEFHDRTTQQKIVKLTKENIVGWTAIQLFKNGFVNTGKHQMPIYQNRIHHALLKRFQNTSIATVLQKEEEFKDLDGDSIIIYLLDGHREIGEYPSDLPMYTEIIDELPEKKELYIRAMNSPPQGKMVYQEISNLTKDLIIDENKGENRLSIFNKMFSELANKLLVSIPPKQPYMPIFILNS